jgi:peptidyl-tRNA hydrolase, PTH1 family
MMYIVGLGNPGEKYADTRHNVGWLLLDAFVTEAGLPHPHQSAEYSGRVSEGVAYGVEVACLYPDTFMNHSGSAVKKLVPKNVVAQLVVLYDDVDLPLGEVKVSFGRGDGGHNGIKSIIASLGTKDFVRVRIGVAQKTVWPWEKGVVRRPRGDALGTFVLASFTKKERHELEAVASTVVEVLRVILTEGKEVAMNRFN